MEKLNSGKVRATRIIETLSKIVAVERLKLRQLLVVLSAWERGR